MTWDWDDLADDHEWGEDATEDEFYGDDGPGFMHEAQPWEPDDGWQLTLWDPDEMGRWL